jgi:hypothetical protein
VELVDHEIWKPWRDVVVFVPGKVGPADNAVTGERRLQLAGVGISLLPLAALPDDIKHVPLAVADTGNESAPMATIVASEQAGVIAPAIVKIADDVHRACMGRQTRKVAPSAMRLAPMGVSARIWSRAVGIDTPCVCFQMCSIHHARTELWLSSAGVTVNANQTV